MKQKNPGQKVVIVFRRRFTRGLLAGLKHEDRLPCVDRWHAAQWLKGIRRNVRKGLLEYRLEFAKVFASR